jgi:hypothetical protein
MSIMKTIVSNKASTWVAALALHYTQ